MIINAFDKSFCALFSVTTKMTTFGVQLYCVFILSLISPLLLDLKCYVAYPYYIMTNISLNKRQILIRFFIIAI